MNYSMFGDRFRENSGIMQLMDDLGVALSNGGDVCMLGGGNPAHISQLQQRFRRAMTELLADGNTFERTIGDYDGPRGEARFIEALTDMLRRYMGWHISADNIAVTNGSQASFFALANLFGGKCADGCHKKIVLPLAPEYIGYSNVGLHDDLFEATRPHIKCYEDGTFKYHVDLDALRVDDEVGAVCVSRPTNPTGNVLSDEEMRYISEKTMRAGVPFIIDSAYGLPFPGIMFSEAQPFWNDDNTVLCLSLSKLGLPGLRTGIIVAPPDIIRKVETITATLNLASGSFGQALVLNMIQSGEILELCRDVVQPFYKKRMQQVVRALRDGLGDLPVRLHKAEGGFFLWLWFKELHITSTQLYELLKAKGLLVVAGEHFFFGLKEEWQHRHECIRLSYGGELSRVLRGIEILINETRELYNNRGDNHGRGRGRKHA